MSSSEVIDFLIKSKKLEPGLLHRVNTTIIHVNAVLYDAEEKQITNPAVKNWLDDLQDCVFEIDDLLDEFAHKAARSKVLNFFSALIPFSYKDEDMVDKLEEILEKIDNLINLKDALKGIEGKPIIPQIPSTTCLVDESDIYGREADQEAIMELLLSNDQNDIVDVVPIVGLCGIGKTTLAQSVFNDYRVDQEFEIRAWVCVGGEFNVFQITKSFLEGITGKTCDYKELNPLQVELRDRLSMRKFLLVLDDIWNVNYEAWELLQKPLKHGRGGGKIIVTTRNESVALVTLTIPIYHLRELSDDDCYTLFRRHAFDSTEGTGEHPQLEGLDREIVRKCRGLPLVAKTLGNLLHFERDAREWDKILRSNIWDLPSDSSILQSLLLSYYQLPSHLKRCFAYCATFPRRHEFTRAEVVRLWTAKELIQPNENRQTEELGDEYFQNLVSRSLFQRSSANPSSFVMHDLNHDLAKFVYRTFFHHRIRRYPHRGDTKDIAEWPFILTNILLEILLLAFDQMASPKKPQYALVAASLSLAVLFVCISELIYKAMKKNSATFFQILRCMLHGSLEKNPYTFIDWFGLLSAFGQVVVSSIAYVYMRQGKDNPIKVSVVSLSFIICLASSKLVKNPNEAQLPTTRGY
ncbi:putative disease resistance RPP13-like protein 1 [Ricinus communis]|uniref:Disease resistance protein RGA2, putative n=1 Tax=Ricinus communis TaxID=3988 RepID=B9RGC0_RICCO|nr:putative disease resistance RPP13-like protein 1 [Ricinus communis]EEF49575.1 Disease resistance protein RGA2, putative [Ricinus communis]|eukprot:XP_002513072.1 putative disease resistance RPP13-like protein 1 [Ricinus communis]